MLKHHRITPRTCLWPLVWCLCATFALSIGLTYSSNHRCYAGVCGEWLFPLQARLHVVVWYLWLSLSTTILTLRAFQPSIRNITGRALGPLVPLLGKRLRLGGVLIALWVCALYGTLIGLWWGRLSQYFEQRGRGLPGNNLVAAVALTGHLADVTMGMVLLPVSRHSALASFLKLSPLTTYAFHMTLAYILFTLVVIHGLLYAGWTGFYNQHRNTFRPIFPVLNPTYHYNEVWPGNTSSLGIWRASLIFTGIVPSTIMLAMFLTSFPVIRRKYFNLFYFVHLLGIVAVIIICLHASTMFYCTIPGLSLWVLDWGMRLFELRGKIQGRLRALGNGWYTLTLPLPRDRLSGCACHSPLAHFYIHHSQSSIIEIHPFTTTTHLASQKLIVSEKADAMIEIQFLFRQSVPSPQRPPQTPSSQDQTQDQHRNQSQNPVRSKSRQWTNRLAMLADEESNVVQAQHHPRHDSTLEPNKLVQPVELEVTEKAEYLRPSSSSSSSSAGVQTSLRLEGPYFTAANPEKYRTVVCLVAGTGLSGALAIAAAFKARKRKPAAQLHETGHPLKTSDDDDVVSPHQTELMPCSMQPGDSEQNAYWTRCVVVWSVRASDYVDIPHFSGLEFRVHRTGARGGGGGGGGQSKRLDVRATLAEICGDDGSDAWTYISGPNGFIAAASQACSELRGLTWFVAQ